MTKYRVEILREDPGGRFSAGEQGIAIRSQWDKYDYLVTLEGSMHLPWMDYLEIPRDYYFYADEIKILEELRDAGGP